MKRSEMIEVIKECLPTIEKLPKLTGRNADYILRKIEKAGMLPPNTRFFMEYSNKDMLKGMEAYRDSLRWESEND